MSMEESMKALTESNLTLAKAMTYYADTITKFGLKIENDNAGTTEKAAAKPEAEPAPEKKTRAKKTDDKPADTEKAKALTFDETKEKLLELRDLHDDKEPALKIVRKYGYESFNDAKPADFQGIYDDAVAAIKKFHANKDI